MRPVIQKSEVFTLRKWAQFTVASFVLSLMMMANGQAEQIKLLALGDSLTAGYGLGPGDGLTEVLQDKINQDLSGKTVQIINAGVSGDTTRGGLARLDWALADDPDIVMVALGGNDMLRGLAPSESYENLKVILQILEQAKKPVLLAGMLAPANMGQDYQREFDQLYPRLAEEFEVIFYPFFLDGVALQADLNQPDGLHPNKAGVEIMATKLVPYIRQLVEKGANE